MQARPQEQEKKPEPGRQVQPAKPAAQPQQRAQPAKQEARPQPQQQQKPAAQPVKQEARPQQQPKPQVQPQQKAAQQPKQPAQPQPQQRAAQQPKQQAQPKQQKKVAQQPKEPAQSPQRAQGQPVQTARNYAPPQRSTQQAQAWQQKSGWRQQGGWQGGATFQADRASNWGSEHRTWAQRGGYGGYYIPQASFGLYFGVGHSFRIGSQPFIVGGYPEFRYGGYTFMMVDPWPGDWATNWFDTDQLYVGYDNGYYLYDQTHPGEAVALTVVM